MQQGKQMHDGMSVSESAFFCVVPVTSRLDRHIYFLEYGSSSSWQRETERFMEGWMDRYINIKILGDISFIFKF